MSTALHDTPPCTSKSIVNESIEATNCQLKLEEELTMARKTIKSLNDYIGSQLIDSSDSERDDDGISDTDGSEFYGFSDMEEEQKQFDGQFARKHGFITNVS